MVVHKMLKSKVEINLAFFCTLILFNLGQLEKNFAQPRNSHSLNKTIFGYENFIQYLKSF